MALKLEAGILQHLGPPMGDPGALLGEALALTGELAHWPRRDTAAAQQPVLEQLAQPSAVGHGGLAAQPLFEVSWGLTNSSSKSWIDPLSWTVLGIKEEGASPWRKVHPPYAPDTGGASANWHRVGRSLNELAREFEPSANAIHYWLRQAGLDYAATV